MKLVAGLGNPGRKYHGTRHNIGWEVLAELARRFAAGRPKQKFNGELVEGTVKGEKLVLLSPLTYMNRSGNSVQPARDFYKLENSDVLIVCDDFNLPVSRLRIRSKGSAGGQKGLQDIIQRLGSNEIPRLRLGIGAPPEGWDVSDYVLSKFTKEEQPLVQTAVLRAAEAVEVWISDGLQACMNRFNADPSEKTSSAKTSSAKTSSAKTSSEKTSSAKDTDKRKTDQKSQQRRTAEQAVTGDRQPPSVDPPASAEHHSDQLPANGSQDHQSRPESN